MRRAIKRVMVMGAMVVALMAAGPASAKKGLYVGGSIGQTTLKVDDFELDLESFDYKADDVSYKLIVGYRFFGFFAVEGSYIDFGNLEDSYSGGGDPVTVEADIKGFDAVAMGMLPLGIADIFVKAGFISWDADLRTAIGDLSERDSDSGTDMVYGLGAQVRFRGLAIRGEFEFFDIADADSLYMISVGATYTF